MVQTYRIEGFSRSLLLLVCCFAVASLVAILIWMGSLGTNGIFLLIVGVLFTKYSLGFFIFRIDVDVEKQQICLYRSWGKYCLNASEVKGWGYRNIWNTEASGVQKNLEIRLKNGKKYVYPVHFLLFKPPEAWKQALIDCIGSSPTVYKSKYLTLESDVLFLLL